MCGAGHATVGTVSGEVSCRWRHPSKRTIRLDSCTHPSTTACSKGKYLASPKGEGDFSEMKAFSGGMCPFEPGNPVVASALCTLAWGSEFTGQVLALDVEIGFDLAGQRPELASRRTHQDEGGSRSVLQRMDHMIGR